MFNKNLKILRKTKGFTQAELAERLNVVRQTISKWEDGLSVPDADMLIKIAEIFEISVDDLLGIELHDQNDIAEELASIKEQLEIKNRRSHCIWKTLAVVIGAVIAVNILLFITVMTSFVKVVPDEQVTVVTDTVMNDQK